MEDAVDILNEKIEELKMEAMEERETNVELSEQLMALQAERDVLKESHAELMTTLEDIQSGRQLALGAKRHSVLHC